MKLLATTCAAALLVVAAGVGPAAAVDERLAPSSTSGDTVARPSAAVVSDATEVDLPNSDFVTVTPGRLLDTRTSGQRPVAGGSVVTVPVTGRYGVPAVGVGTVLLNLTAVAPTSNGFMTVWPTGQARPNASNVNYVQGRNVANAVVVAVGRGGTVSVYASSGTTHALVDVTGWASEGSDVVPVTPDRQLDTRTTRTPVPAGGTVVHRLTGRSGIPATGVGTVLLNLTAVAPTAAGFMTVWPTGEPRPLASNLNFTAGSTVANVVVARVGPDGTVNLFNAAGSTHVLVDVLAWAPVESDLVALAPSRVLDTRDTRTPLTAGGIAVLPVLGRGGVPATGVATVLLNVTAVVPTRSGFLTLWAAGQPRPNASSVNFTPGRAVANLVAATVGRDGNVDIYNSAGATHVVVDVLGWVPDSTTAGSTKLLVPSATHLYGSTDVASLASDKGISSLQLSRSADDARVGDHVVLMRSDVAPTGLVGKVTAVGATSAGTPTVVLQEESLDEALVDFSIDYSGPVGTAPALRAAGPSYVKLPEITFATPERLGLSCEGTVSDKPDIRISDVRMEQPDSDFSITKGGFFGLEPVASFRFTGVANFRYALSSAGLKSSCAWRGFANLPIIIPTPIPLWLTAQPIVRVQIEGGGQVEGKVRQRVTAGFTAKPSGVTPSFNVSDAGSTVDRAQGRIASLSLLGGLEFELSAVGRVGIRLLFGGQVKGVVDASVSPCVVSLDRGLRVELDVVLHAFVLDLSKDLGGRDLGMVPLYRGGCAGSPPTTTTAPPATSSGGETAPPPTGAAGPTAPSGGLAFSVSPGVCSTTQCGSLSTANRGTSSGFTPGGTVGIRVYAPDGQDGNVLGGGYAYVSTARVDSGGRFPWAYWWEAGMATGTYRTVVRDNATGREAAAAFTYTEPSAPPQTGAPALRLSQGAAYNGGWWYAASLSGFAPGSQVAVTCRDSVDPQGFWTQTFTADAAGNAGDSTLCYSADGPDHWITGAGIESNHVSWSRTTTTPPPAGTAPGITLDRGAATQGGYWYSVTLRGFAPGSQVTVTCRDSVDPGGFWNQTFTIDGGGAAGDSTLCYSADGPDHWVTGGGTESNHVGW